MLKLRNLHLYDNVEDTWRDGAWIDNTPVEAGERIVNYRPLKQTMAVHP